MLTFMLFLLVCLCFSRFLTALAAYRVRAVALRQAGQGSVARRRRWAKPDSPGRPGCRGCRARRSMATRCSGASGSALQALPVPSRGVGSLHGHGADRLCRRADDRTSELADAGRGHCRHVRLSSCGWIAAIERERLDRSGRGGAARGSIDAPLSTPLSTLSIVIGKWWGAFRLASHVIFWPACLAAILLWNGGSWFGYILLLVLLLAYCAAIASLGLAVATWVSRLGRAWRSV